MTIGKIWPVSAGDLLDLWEWGLYHTPVERALALVSAGLPDHSMDDLARQAVGRRNLILYYLRESLFGSELALQTACPQCSEPLEMQIPITVVTAAANAGGEPGLEDHQTVEANGQTIHFRLPNSLDLLEASAYAEPRRVLLARCLEPSALQKEPALLSPEAEAALLEKMQSLDPLANVSFALTCPGCSHAWAAPFDIVSYLWNEIDAWAYRTLREVHWLASMYHWGEAEILALGRWRRQAYLQMSGYA